MSWEGHQKPHPSVVTAMGFLHEEVPHLCPRLTPKAALVWCILCFPPERDASGSLSVCGLYLWCMRKKQEAPKRKGLVLSVAVVCW